MTSGDYEIQEQMEMDARILNDLAEQAECEWLRLGRREAAKLHGRAATIRRLYAALLEVQDSKRYADEVVAGYVVDARARNLAFAALVLIDRGSPDYRKIASEALRAIEAAMSAERGEE